MAKKNNDITDKFIKIDEDIASLTYLGYSWTEIVVLSKLKALSVGTNGCTASNTWLCWYFNVSHNTLSRVLQKLHNNNLICVKQEKNTMWGTSRHIYIEYTFLKELTTKAVMAKNNVSPQSESDLETTHKKSKKSSDSTSKNSKNNTNSLPKVWGGGSPETGEGYPQKLGSDSLPNNCKLTTQVLSTHLPEVGKSIVRENKIITINATTDVVDGDELILYHDDNLSHDTTSEHDDNSSDSLENTINNYWNSLSPILQHTYLNHQSVVQAKNQAYTRCNIDNQKSFTDQDILNYFNTSDKQIWLQTNHLDIYNRLFTSGEKNNDLSWLYVDLNEQGE